MEGLRLDRAIVRGAGPGDRERLVAALAPVSPEATGIPASATLIVRKVTMPVPLPRNGSTDRFAATLHDLLRARLATATRGPHCSEGGDYLFEDDAALEVAIVADWLTASTPTGRRWWTSVVGTAPPPERWRRHILQDAVRLPRIIARLVEADCAVDWLARFEPGELAAATDRMLQAAGAVEVPSADLADAGNAGPKPQGALSATSTVPRHENPIARVCPEAGLFAPGAARRFAAVALVLARRPALAVTSRFGGDLVRFAAGPALRARSPSPRTRQAARPRSRPAPTAGGAPVRTARSIDPAGVGVPDATSPARPVQPSSARQSGQPQLANAGVQTAKTAPISLLLATTDATLPDAHASIRSVVDTEFGGLFFFLNAFTSLGLYGDFTRPADGLRGLSPFELLDLLGARWFGRDYRRDPLAPLLHRLAGLEPRQRAGRDFEPPEWTVPDTWLRPWPMAKPMRRGSALWHPAGFPLADDGAAPLSMGWARRRWVHCLARYLAARLKQAMGDDEAVALVCRRPATIAHDTESVEISFVLDRHPLALRLDGLDRNLGWLPAAGRCIAFVFA